MARVQHRMTMVVFDAMGVLYEAGDDVADLLVPFLRESGCALDDADIGRLYHQASLGRLTSAEFWASCGVGADDRTYCARHTMVPGIEALLGDLARAGVPTACLSNDVTEWSALVRQRFGLDRRIGTWVISSDIGARKPDPAAFRALGDATGVPPARMMFFDDRKANVDAARAAGLEAVVFSGASHARDVLCERGILPVRGQL
ncbi:HAD-IA family hydrolase [Brooklawnia cerclae]|uniref:Hydrolase of the HAD superfamily n=1 Tax=Brooklawnia cerclae TaxID=349934 RepID=A0ABX0SD34_9ACTN|nr:HAD-IA family hydrolase [Brooklawnia cerclae]NIH56308.1 putative hydrolase of the HAD superfamily [Brooklawnia cerclae]